MSQPEEDDDDDYVELEEELIAFERLHNQEAVPEGFSAATVLLDVSPTSELQWNEAINSGKELIAKGYQVLFDFDLRLSKPFSHTGQFQAYSFAFTHFRETIWPEFKEHSAGIILSRSSLALDKHFLWGGKEQETRVEQKISETALPFFCRDMFVEYFSLLVLQLPDDCPVTLLFDCKEIEDPALFALLTAQDRFPRFRLGVQNAPFAIHALSWQDNSSSKEYIGRHYHPAEKPSAIVGVLLPTHEQLEEANRHRLQKNIDHLLKNNIPFKTISQDFLTMEWEGLDTIILSHNNPSVPLQRALDGFSAAGGNVILADDNKKIDMN